LPSMQQLAAEHRTRANVLAGLATVLARHTCCLACLCQPSLLVRPRAWARRRQPILHTIRKREQRVWMNKGSEGLQNMAPARGGNADKNVTVSEWAMKIMSCMSRAFVASTDACWR